MRQSGRGLFGQQPAIDQQFGDLHRVQRRALPEIVGDDPQRQAVFHRWILADAGYIGGVLAGAFIRRHVAAILVLVDDQAAGRLAQDIARFLGADYHFAVGR